MVVATKMGEPLVPDADAMTGWRLPRNVARAQRFRTTLAAQRHDEDNSEAYARLLRELASSLERPPSAKDA